MKIRIIKDCYMRNIIIPSKDASIAKDCDFNINDLIHLTLLQSYIKSTIDHRVYLFKNHIYGIGFSKSTRWYSIEFMYE